MGLGSKNILGSSLHENLVETLQLYFEPQQNFSDGSVNGPDYAKFLNELSSED